MTALLGTALLEFSNLGFKIENLVAITFGDHRLEQKKPMLSDIPELAL